MQINPEAQKIISWLISLIHMDEYLAIYTDLSKNEQIWINNIILAHDKLMASKDYPWIVKEWFNSSALQSCQFADNPKDYSKEQMLEITNLPYREAVTYRDTAPHEYIVYDKLPENQKLNFKLFNIYLREFGINKPYFNQTMRHIETNGYTYWNMRGSVFSTVIINRADLQENNRLSERWTPKKEDPNSEETTLK